MYNDIKTKIKSLFAKLNAFKAFGQVLQFLYSLASIEASGFDLI